MDQDIKAATQKKVGNARREARADETTVAARSILNAEASAREAKTARLRAARLKAEAETPVIVTPAKRKRATKKGRK